MTSTEQTRCLLLACGNTLRGDDGVGPWLAEWAEERFPALDGLRVISRQQWTLELVEEVARAASVLFLDCSIDAEPGVVLLASVAAVPSSEGLSTHHLGASELLALARDYYGSQPRQALLLTVGAASTELGEGFSEAVQAVLPEACKMLEEVLLRVLQN
jgi:hydrogenase maturation protease